MENKILKELLEGNKRFANEANEFQRVNEKRRKEGVKGQNPKAIIIGCADSRVSPELIFDQGLGDLFVIRVAGNIIDDAIVGSIEYAVAELKTSLIIVLAHASCGAVNAAIDYKPEEAPGKIGTLIEAIQPSVEKAKSLDGDLLYNAIRENSKDVAKQLEEQGAIIKSAILNNKLDIVPAYYDINSGLVEIL